MRLWADECSDSCQLPLDPTIAVVLRDGDRIGVVNQLHRDLVTTIGDYQVISAGQKGVGLRYQTDRRDDAADALIADAREASESVCTICGDVATPANPPRCDRHPRRSTPVVIARPPGWSPPAA